MNRKTFKKLLYRWQLKQNNPEHFIRKLSSYAKKNKTKRALWELDNIVSSIYILDYIDTL